jgi:hypothetical protein
LQGCFDNLTAAQVSSDAGADRGRQRHPITELQRPLPPPLPPYVNGDPCGDNQQAANFDRDQAAALNGLAIETLA